MGKKTLFTSLLILILMGCIGSPKSVLKSTKISAETNTSDSNNSLENNQSIQNIDLNVSETNQTTLPELNITTPIIKKRVIKKNIKRRSSRSVECVNCMAKFKPKRWDRKVLTKESYYDMCPMCKPNYLR